MERRMEYLDWSSDGQAMNSGPRHHKKTNMNNVKKTSPITMR